MIFFEYESEGENFYFIIQSWLNRQQYFDRDEILQESENVFDQFYNDTKAHVRYNEFLVVLKQFVNDF
jgi:hypothetical protein